MINIADQLHAATADGVLANASEIKDGTKMQSQINAEVQTALGGKADASAVTAEAAARQAADDEIEDLLAAAL